MISKTTASAKWKTVCWQGWSLRLPRRWEVVRLSGSYESGQALFADAKRSRLGLRWGTVSEPAVKKVMLASLRQEVGTLAASEAKPVESIPAFSSAHSYREKEPPGRDFFVGYSPISGRVLEVSYPVRRREDVLEKLLLPAIADCPNERAMPWSIFDLSCLAPCGMKLKSHQLNAGDLSLQFVDRLATVRVRQIAVARLALLRMPLEKWVVQEQEMQSRFYRVKGAIDEVELHLADGVVQAKRGWQTRRKRFSFMRSVFPQSCTMAAHDVQRDRIVILQGSDESLLHEVASSVGQTEFACGS